MCYRRSLDLVIPSILNHCYKADIKIHLSTPITFTINTFHHESLFGFDTAIPVSDMACVESHDRPTVMHAASPSWMLSQIDQTCCSKWQLNQNKRLERGFASNQDSRTVTCLAGKILIYFPLSPFLHLILLIWLVDSTNGPVHWFRNMHIAYRNKCIQQRTRAGRYAVA
jgi:hypothetical protein